MCLNTLPTGFFLQVMDMKSCMFTPCYYVQAYPRIRSFQVGVTTFEFHVKSLLNLTDTKQNHSHQEILVHQITMCCGNILTTVTYSEKNLLGRKKIIELEIKLPTDKDNKSSSRAYIILYSLLQFIQQRIRKLYNFRSIQHHKKFQNLYLRFFCNFVEYN